MEYPYNPKNLLRIFIISLKYFINPPFTMTKPSNRWDFLFLCYQRCKGSCYAHTSRFNNSKYKFPSWRDVSHCSKIQSHWWYKSHVVCLRGSQIGYKYWANGCAKIHLCAGIAHPKPRRMLQCHQCQFSVGAW